MAASAQSSACLCGSCHERAEPGRSPPPAFAALSTRDALPAREPPQDTLLTRYFHEVGKRPLFTPAEEVERAREIERLEVALWSRILDHPALRRALLHLAQRRLEATLDRADGTTGAARTIRSLDVDRVLLDEVVGQLRELRGPGPHRIGGRRVRVDGRGRAFGSYLRAVEELYTRSQAARNAFVESNLRLVVTIARRYHFGKLSFQDLIQEGNLGLIKAVGRFDHRRGNRFTTYASWWIRHTITRGLSDRGRLVRIPVHLHSRRQQLQRLQQELSTRLGRTPTSEEVCLCTGLRLDQVEQLLDHAPGAAVSLDRELVEDEGASFLDMLQDPDQPSPVERAIATDLLERIRGVLPTLKPIEAEVLRDRYGLGDGREQTLDEIGRRHGLSRERIRQIQEQALSRVRRALELGVGRAQRG